MLLELASSFPRSKNGSFDQSRRYSKRVEKAFDHLIVGRQGELLHRLRHPVIKPSRSLYQS